ncbi:hypothetical protein [Streptomyces sp. NBC_01669]|nr:hypothetical protein [Streptomyces sp. NBC_01669]MCX4537704.1 hypothetical protein [Streptomyces sp. NBC_01669]
MTNHLTREQMRRTAAEGWIYGHPMLENYRTMYAQAIDTTDPALAENVIH